MCNYEVTFIEVFQDLILASCDGQHSSICEALRRNAAPPWHHAQERDLATHNSMHKYVAFQRSSSDDIAASRLTLCERTNGYEVMNIVPLEDPDLGITGKTMPSMISLRKLLSLPPKN